MHSFPSLERSHLYSTPMNNNLSNVCMFPDFRNETKFANELDSILNAYRQEVFIPTDQLVHGSPERSNKEFEYLQKK